MITVFDKKRIAQLEGSFGVGGYVERVHQLLTHIDSERRR